MNNQTFIKGDEVITELEDTPITKGVGYGKLLRINKEGLAEILVVETNYNMGGQSAKVIFDPLEIKHENESLKPVQSVPVHYGMYGTIEVRGDSLKEAAERVERGSYPLPEYPDYIEDSFHVDKEAINEKKQK